VLTMSLAAPDPGSGSPGPATRARDDLIVRHMPLAKRLARRYARHPDSFEDVEQVAAVGLVKAAGRFDASRGVAFSSFAVPTIVGEIKRYFRDTCWAVHVPRELQERTQRVEAAKRRLADAQGQPPSSSELADALGMTVEQVLETRTAFASFYAESLDAPSLAEGNDDSRGDQMGAIDDAYALVEERVSIEPGISTLPERERLVLLLRYRFDLTQREIGERIGVSQMHISRLLRRSLETVRAATEY
jgi:RNA polymerase sigma-B factor